MVAKSDKQLHSFKDLVVWQHAMELVVATYELTERFPPEELYGLTSQLRRAAISVLSNIAEGRLRGTRKEFRAFLLRSYSSGGEVETQVELSKRLRKTGYLDYRRVDSLLAEVMRMLNSMIVSLGEPVHARQTKVRQ